MLMIDKDNEQEFEVRMLPTKERKNSSCGVCHSTRSVKYAIEKKKFCNRCILFRRDDVLHVIREITMVTEASNKVKFSFELEYDDEAIEDIIEMAGYGIGYWADNAIFDPDGKTYRVYWGASEGEDDDLQNRMLTYDMIREGIRKLLNKEVKISNNLYSYLISMDGDKPDLGNYDSDLCDCIIQSALFDEVRYG